MLAGTLEIQLLANMARLQKDMDDAKRSVGGAMGAIERSVGAATTALGALGAGLSVAALAAYATRAIDAADAMNDLSQRVGIAVKDLAAYELATSQSGTSMESLAKGIKGLSGNLVEHGAALRKAGISATTADGALRQVADVFAKMPDGMEKTTLAVKLFGKSGMELIPMLNQGSAGLEMAAEKSAKYSAQMSIMAPLADTYNDNMAEIAMHNKVAGMTMMNELLPSLIAITGAMAQAAEKGGFLKGVMAGLDEFGEQAFDWTGNNQRKNIANLVDDLADLQEKQALIKIDVFGQKGIIQTQIEEKTKALEAARKAYFGFTEGNAGRGSVNPASVTPKTDVMAEYRALMGALGGGDADAAAKKAKALIDAAKELANGLLQQDLGLSPDFLKKWDSLNLAYDKGGLELASLIKAQKVLLDQQPALKKAHEAEEKYLQDIMAARSALRQKEDEGIADYLLKQQESYNAAVKGSNDEVKAAQAVFDQYGLNKSQIAQITLLTLQGEQAKLHAWSEGYQALQIQIDNQKKLIGILADTEALDAQKAMWVSIEQAAHTAFNTTVQGGEDMWIKLRESGKAMFFDWLYQMTAKKWLIDMSASISGQNVAQSAFGSAANGLNTASSLNSLWGAGSQFLTGATAGASTASLVGANAVGAVGGDALGALIAGNGGWAGVTVAAEAGAATAATAGATAGASSVLAAIPGWGWAALGAAALFSMFGNDGPKVQGTGSATTAFDASGKTTGTNAFGNSFDFQTASADNFVAGLQSGYLSAAKSLGIANAGGTFGFGSNDSDGGKFGVGARVGSANYSSTDIKLTDEALKLEAARAVFAALQGSELPTFLSGVFDGITATTATQEQINTALTYAQGLKAIHDQLEAMNVKGLSKSALDGLAQFSGGIANLSANLAGFNSNFLTEEEKRAQTIATIVDTLNAAGAQLTAADVAATTRETFKALVQGVKDLETEAGQKTYAALLSVQAAFASVTEASNDAATALAEAAAAQRANEEAARANAAAWAEYGRRLDAEAKARADALKQAQDTVAGLRNEATTAYLAAQQKVTAAQQTLANVLKSTITSFEDVLASMDGGRSPTLQLAGARTAFDDLTARARMGDTAAIGALAGSAKSFLALSKDYSVSLQDYRRDEARIRLVMQEGIAAGQKQLKTLPVEMQKATDPIKAAYDELAKATKAEQDARVLAIAMQASLTATEKTLAEKYLEAIKGLPEGDALKTFYDETMAAAAAAAAIATASATAAQAILVTLAANAATALAAANTATATTTTAQSGLSMLGNGLIRKDGADGTSLFWARDVAAGLNDYAAANGSLAATQRAYELGATTAMLEEIRKASVGLPQFAKGTNYLDRDMVIQAHRGETITPATYVDVERSAREEGNTLLAQLVNSNATLTARLDAMVSAAITTAANTGETASAAQRNVGLVEQICFGGASVQTRAAGVPA